MGRMMKMEQHLMPGKSLARSGGRTDGWDLFVLTMCRQRLGQPDRAKADLARAVAWMS
jgi:hypothetical protein